MREVQAAVAQASLEELLDDVERGETIIITRHNQAIARLVPEYIERKKEIDEAIANIKRLQKGMHLTVDEILSLRHEGHKY